MGLWDLYLFVNLLLASRMKLRWVVGHRGACRQSPVPPTLQVTFIAAGVACKSSQLTGCCQRSSNEQQARI